MLARNQALTRESQHRRCLLASAASALATRRPSATPMEVKVLDTTMAVPLASVEMLKQAVAHLQAVQPKFVPLVEAHGLPEKMLAKTEACFGALAKSIVYQQLAGKAAETILGRVLKVCGCSCVDHLQPAAVSQAAAADLRAAGLSERKLAYLTGLAEQFEGKQLCDAGIRAMPDATLMTTLTALNGIGPWTVNMFAMFHLGHPDVLPVGDLAIRKGVQAMHNLSKLPTPSEMEDVTNSWRPYRSVGCWYLWRMPESSVRSPAGKKLSSPKTKPALKKAPAPKSAAAAAGGTEEEPHKTNARRALKAAPASLAEIQQAEEAAAIVPKKPRRAAKAAVEVVVGAAEEAAFSTPTKRVRRAVKAAVDAVVGTAEEGVASLSAPTKRRRKTAK